jgi:hypothetical protein
MMKFTTATLLTTLIALGFSLTARGAGDPEPLTPSVALGSDYFQTGPGSFFNFGPPIGSVNFMGLPIGPGNTDTIVQRQADASIGGPAIPIQIVALSLESTAPVNVGGSFFDVFVTLNPADLALDTGTLSVAGTTAGGTFSSSLNVFFDAHFQPLGGGTPFDVLSSALLSNTGAFWSSTPSAGEVIVNGPDNGSAADQSANLHSGLIGCPNVTGGNGCEVDFFVTGQVHETNTGESHVVMEATPEPRMLLLLVPAVIALGLKRKLRRA